jgi:hypothetical protein
VILAGSIGIVHGQGLLSSVLATTAAVIAVQMGYLIGMVARAATEHGITAARKSRGERRPGLYEWFSHFTRP